MVNLTQYAAARDEIRKTIRDKSVQGITSDWCENCSTFPSQVQKSHAKGKCEFAYCEICPVDVPRRLLHDNPNLLSDLWKSSVDDLSPNTEADIDKFRERVCGIKTDPVTSGLSRCLVAFVLDIETPEAEEWQAFIHLCMDDESQLKDGDLPLSHVSYESHFSRQGSKFLSTQYRFCPVSVKQNDISPYIGAGADCRRPYTIQRQLGRGAYGTVHEVQFTTQQFFFEDTGSVNRVGQCYAVKHIRLDEKYDREWHAATALLDCNRQHTTIMHTLAAIRYPGHLSLFYHVATCDLEHFMADEPPPANLAARRQMLSKMVDIADAISFLHDGLWTSKGAKIHCYHLDLKPGNVLVVAGENRPDSLAFKLADFGISSIKRGDDSWDLRSLFRTQPATSLVDSARNTWGLQNGAGVCLAPEASEPSSPSYLGVNYAADVWSFCAMLSIFIAWVSDGVSGIEDFRKARLCFDGPFETDQFFKTRESSATRPEDGPFERKEEVDKWYEGLESPRSGREGAELSLYGQLWLVVQEGLEPQPLRRPIMYNVNATLNNMLKLGKPYDRSLLFPQGRMTDAYRPDLRGGTHPKILDDWRYVKREELQTRLFSFCARPRGRGRERHEWFLLYGRSGSGKSHACFNLCETEEIRKLFLHRYWLRATNHAALISDIQDALDPKDLQQASGATKPNVNLKSLQQRLRSRLIREGERDRWLIIFDDWHPAALPWAQLSECLPQDGTVSGVVIINSEVNDGSVPMNPPTELFKMKGLAVEDGVRLLRDILQRNEGSSADSEPWLPDDFEDKADGLAQRFCELPGVLFLVGQQIREQHLTIQVALEINGSANEVLWGMVSRLEDNLNKRPKDMALNTLLLFVLAHLNTHCDIVEIFVSAAHILRKYPNQELVIPPESLIPYLDDGLEPDKMESRIQLALSELHGRHFLNLRNDNKSSEMEESTSGSIRDLLGSREQTSRYWLTAARLIALGRLGSKQSIAHLTMARHVDKLLSYKPRVVQLVDVQLFLGPTPDHAQFPTAAAECFADIFLECGFLQRALDLRGFICDKSRQSDSKRWQFLACTALASAYAAVENWPKAIELCREAFQMGGDTLNTMSTLADEAEYHGRYGQIKRAREILGELSQGVEEAWEDTRNPTVLRLWLRVARLNANILTVNASDCKEGRRLLNGVLEVYQVKLPEDDRDLLSAKSDLAHACLRDGAPEDALKLYATLLKVFQRSSAYRLDVLSSYERISECYSKLQKNKQALDYQTAAYHLLKKIDNDDGSVPKSRLEETLCNLATTYHRYGELRKARRAYSDVYDSQESRKASSADLSKSWHALVVLRIDTMRASKEPLPGDVWAIIASDMAWLTKLVGAACRENETSMLQRYTARISLEETKIKYVDLEMSRRDKAWWPEHYERPLAMAVRATEELGRIYPDVKQEFGETGALTLRCALAFGHGHTLGACIKDNLKPGLLRDSRYEDVKTARVWLYHIKRRLDDSEISREHREATRYLEKLKRSFGGVEDIRGGGLMFAILYCYCDQ